MSTPLKSHSVNTTRSVRHPAQIVVTEVVAVEFPLGPDRFVFAHAVSRAPT